MNSPTPTSAPPAPAGPTRRVLILRFVVVWALLLVPALLAVASTRLAERPGPPPVGASSPLRMAPGCAPGEPGC